MPRSPHGTGASELWLHPMPATQRVAPPRRSGQHRASDRTAQIPITGTKFISVAPARDRAKRQPPSVRTAVPHGALTRPAPSRKDVSSAWSHGHSFGALSSNSSHIRLLSPPHAATIRTSAPPEGQAPDELWLQPANRDPVDWAVARPSIRRRPGPPRSRPRCSWGRA